jgi:malto-oligosyltrehalose trehalohydrolase
VVYNHFGPAGNLLGEYAPSFFTERHHTPWGAGFNFDGEPAVRQFFIENALFWLEHYRLDGLRLDAVHAIADDSAQHIVDEICAVVRRTFRDRHVHLILENEHNEAHRLIRADGRPVLFDAQWNDDLHHSLHVLATGEAAGYYGDYVGDRGKLLRAIAEGFAFQGEVMRYSDKPRGEPSGHLPPACFISFLQNHDQIGNRAFGERIGALATPEAVRAMAAIYLLAPQMPMLFMGEEWAAAEPFPFFCDFDGELGNQVRDGRRAEFSRFPEFSSPSQRARIPDPLSEGTVDAARLRWETASDAVHREVLDWYRAVIAARRSEIVRRLPYIERGGVSEILGEGVIRVTWNVGDVEQLILTANLSHHLAAAGKTPPGGLVWQQGQWTGEVMGPWCVAWSVEASP